MGMTNPQRHGRRLVWVFSVLDVENNEVALAYSAEGGSVTCSGPKWWKADPDTSAKIRDAQQQAEGRAREQRGQATT